MDYHQGPSIRTLSNILGIQRIYHRCLFIRIVFHMLGADPSVGGFQSALSFHSPYVNFEWVTPSLLPPLRFCCFRLRAPYSAAVLDLNRVGSSTLSSSLYSVLLIVLSSPSTFNSLQSEICTRGFILLAEHVLSGAWPCILSSRQDSVPKSFSHVVTLILVFVFVPRHASVILGNGVATFFSALKKTV